jgi:two-component system chemotaxis sensor kinase CheA
VPVDPLLRELVASFWLEAQELCQRVTHDLLFLEKVPSGGEQLSAPYDDLARGLHTLKGSAATLGLDDLASLAHVLEDVVAPARRSLRPFPVAVADELLGGLDLYMVRLKAYSEGTDGAPSDLEAGLERLQRIAEQVQAADPAVPEAGGPAAGDAENSADAPRLALEDPASWRVDSGQVQGLLREVERLRELQLRLDERVRELDEGLAALPRDTSRAEALLASARRALAADGEESAALVAAFEDEVKAICTLPVRTILDPLQRSVRDLCRASGKEARLSVLGAEVSIDRRVLEELRAPLVHLIRNAVDHGIESPAERERRGKHREGSLVVRVEQQGNMVFVEVSDDGAGLDPDQIRQAAARRGLRSEEVLQSLDYGQLIQLIFTSGFSTRDEVTSTSGRGVGLDVVRRQVEALRGYVDIQSAVGQGTRFTLTLPAELGSSLVLVVRCGEQQFGLPLLAVEAVIGCRREDVHASADGMHLLYRDQILPLEDLAARLCLRPPRAPEEGRPLLIIQSQAQRVALAVDEVVGDRDLVIRPLPGEVRGLPAYQGSSTLARGELLLILRAAWLAQLEGRLEGSKYGARQALVVDDSPPARTLLRSLLEAGGFGVHAVGSGAQALEQLRHAIYDVVVSDVAMEPMDGLALAAEVRRRPEWRALPLVLVSTRDAAVLRERAAAVGANAFLRKQDCDSGRLLAEVNALIARQLAASTG